MFIAKLHKEKKLKYGQTFGSTGLKTMLRRYKMVTIPYEDLSYLYKRPYIRSTIFLESKQSRRLLHTTFKALCEESNAPDGVNKGVGVQGKSSIPIDPQGVPRNARIGPPSFEIGPSKDWSNQRPGQSSKVGEFIESNMKVAAER